MTDYYDSVIAEAAQKRARRREDNTAAVARSRKTARSQALQRARKRRRLDLPWVGFDGEGITIAGRHRYALLRIGDAVLYDDNRPLKTTDCLDFILDTPANVNICGYYTGYDVEKILADVPPDVMSEILAEGRPPEREYVYWLDYAIAWRPGHYLRVSRVNPRTYKVIHGANRTVFEMGHNFQGRFVEALRQWDVGDKATREKMAETKAGRAGFTEITKEIEDYNRVEVETIALLCERFRDRVRDAGIEPPAWNGPGKLATGLLKQFKVMKGEKAKENVPDQLWGVAESYLKVGGRHEVAWYGRIPEAWVHDCRGAYAASMLELPCLEHGTWKEFEGAPAAYIDLYCAEVIFNHPPQTVWAGLPWRYKTQDLLWPRLGRGWFWGHEIESAGKLGAKVSWKRGYAYKKNCDCKPFAFLGLLHKERLRLDRQVEGRGLPLKLAINAISGKLSQSLGGGSPWSNPIWSSLTTSRVRAWLNRAIATAKGKGGQLSPVIALAGDAVVTMSPLDLPEGDGLGQWKTTYLGESFFVKPGIYWSQFGEVRSCGIARDDMLTVTERFEAEFNKWIVQLGKIPGPLPLPFPNIYYQQRGFVSARQALFENRPEMIGQWEEQERFLTLSWGQRRDIAFAREADLLMTLAQDGYRNTSSWPLGKRKPGDPPTMLERERWHREAQPDAIEGMEDLV